MSVPILQFGEKPERYTDRKCSYAVVVNADGKILVLRKPDGTVHLPGGGIDDGEDSQMAAIRETLEEADCEITDLKLIGSANQYYKKTKRGPMNKLGVFYSARLVRTGSGGIEPDHEVWWLTPAEFIAEHSADFQKWAVEKVIQ